jgi:inosine/xanthosine triphosphatase
MKKVVVATRNPVKIRAAENGFGAVFPDGAFIFEGVEVPSGVRDQPESDAETRLGAQVRARNAQSSFPEADYWIGIEGGIEDAEPGMLAFAWVCIRSATHTGQSRTGAFQLPPAVANLVRQGVELGIADDLVFERENSKQNDGAVGILTDGLIDRARYYEHAVMLALIPLINPGSYPPRAEHQDNFGDPNDI